MPSFAHRTNQCHGFTLLEMLVVLGIIGLLATFAVPASLSALARARDAKRKSTIAQIGRFLSAQACYRPDAGTGDYDLGQLFDEVKAKNPAIGQFLSSVPRDPRGGTDAITKYRYVTNEDASKCALYANLENANEEVTLVTLAAPTPGGGTGVLASPSPGPNGSNRWFQVSN